MEAELVPALSPLLEGADQWQEILLLLPVLVALEAVLSADNAIALAAIARRLHDPARQRQALNLGMLLALLFRFALILAARWVLDAWPLQLLAAGYLLWLSGRHFLQLDAEEEEPQDAESSGESGSAPGQPAAAAALGSLGRVALTLGFTDLAFSLDSVAAAVAVTDRLALVMLGGAIGVVALRLTAGLFLRWLEIYSRLEAAGYLAVGLVGIRLLLRLALPDLELPEWSLLLIVAALFVWGFSRRHPAEEDAQPPSPAPADRDSSAAEIAEVRVKAIVDANDEPCI